MSEDWYRNKTWSAEIERHFFQKLARARSQKAQYLRIQASYLSLCHPEIALNLLDRYFSLEDHFDLAQAYVDQAHSYVALGNNEAAAGAFVKALAREEAFPNLKTSAGFEFPLFVAEHEMRERYDFALHIIERSREMAMFPVDKFRNAAAAALIYSALRRDQEAKEFAILGLQYAQLTHSPFPRHASLGLVGHEHIELREKLHRLAA